MESENNHKLTPIPTGTIQYVDELPESEALHVETEHTDWFLDGRTGKVLWSADKVRYVPSTQYRDYSSINLGAVRAPVFARGVTSHLLNTTQDGVKIETLPNENIVSYRKYIVDASALNPRAFLPPPLSPLRNGATLFDMIAASVSRTLVEIIAIMLPAYCVYRVARYRRFSLWQLLLAPLIVILSMFAWQRSAYQMGWQHPVATFLMVAYMTFWIGGLNYFALCRFFYKRAEGKPA